MENKQVQWSCVVEGIHVTPYVRMTQKSKHCDPRALRYRRCQQELAGAFRGLGLGSVGRYPCRVRIRYSLDDQRKRAGDCDNVAKTVLDSLVWAGVLSDDSMRQVLGVSIEVEVEVGGVQKLEVEVE